MPVIKSTRRALRSSSKKAEVNKLLNKRLDIAMRLAERKKTKESIAEAKSLTDKAANKGVIHKNKASRLKSRLSKFQSSNKTKSPSSNMKQKG